MGLKVELYLRHNVFLADQGNTSQTEAQQTKLPAYCAQKEKHQIQLEQPTAEPVKAVLQEATILIQEPVLVLVAVPANMIRSVEKVVAVPVTAVQPVITPVHMEQRHVKIALPESIMMK